MFLLASFLVFAFIGYAYVGLRLWVLETYPIGYYALLALALALAGVQITRGKNCLLKACSLIPFGLAAVFLYGIHFMTLYGDDRPHGPAVGEGFPRTTMLDVTGTKALPVGVASATSKLQLIVLFRGFW